MEKTTIVRGSSASLAILYLLQAVLAYPKDISLFYPMMDLVIAAVYVMVAYHLKQGEKWELKSNSFFWFLLMKYHMLIQIGFTHYFFAVKGNPDNLPLLTILLVLPFLFGMLFVAITLLIVEGIEVIQEWNMESENKVKEKKEESSSVYTYPNYGEDLIFNEEITAWDLAKKLQNFYETENDMESKHRVDSSVRKINESMDMITYVSEQSKQEAVAIIQSMIRELDRKLDEKLLPHDVYYLEQMRKKEKYIQSI